MKLRDLSLKLLDYLGLRHNQGGKLVIRRTPIPSLHPKIIPQRRSSPTNNLTSYIVLWGHDRAAAYRTLEKGEPLKAEYVTWHYLGSAVPTIHAALRLMFAYEPSYPIPPECQIPETAWRRFTLRVGR